MFKRFSRLCACWLLVLMPLQSFAAVNMSICNDMMQVEVSQQEKTQIMPCHQHTKSMLDAKENLPDKPSSCQTSCTALCASLCAITALPSNIMPLSLQVSAQAASLLNQTYTSITLENSQRPPIHLS